MHGRDARRTGGRPTWIVAFLTVGLLAACATVGTTVAPTTTSESVADPSSPGADATSLPPDATWVLPPTPSPTTSTTTAPTAAPTAAPTFSPPPGSDIYVVVAGDTLWDLAQWYGLTIDELLAANPQVADRSLIRVGDEILIPPSSTTDGVPAAGRHVTIDFSLAGKSTAFDSRSFKGEPIIFPPQDCRWEQCFDWFIGYIQGDDAIVNGPTPVTFTRPVSSLSVRVAPGAQGKAGYTLTVFDRGGKAIASRSVIVAQYIADPQVTPLGYFSVELGPLSRPARSFTFEQTTIEMPSGMSNVTYGMSEISFTTVR